MTGNAYRPSSRLPAPPADRARGWPELAAHAGQRIEDDVFDGFRCTIGNTRATRRRIQPEEKQVGRVCPALKQAIALQPHTPALAISWRGAPHDAYACWWGRCS